MTGEQEIELSEIPGLGPARCAALAAIGVEDLRGLLALKVVELAAVRGIGMWHARRIREFLRQRGLLSESDDGAGAPLIHPSASPQEMAAVETALQEMQEHARAEAETEAVVQALSAALAAADDGAGEPGPESGGEDGGEKDAGAAGEDAGQPDDPAEAAAAGRQEVRQRKERIPDAALALMEAIRQAAVSRQLTRQLTRLLIAAGEFTSDARSLPADRLQRAADLLAEVETLLQRAMQRQGFRPADQKELAGRIRRRRKALDRLLEE